MSYNTCHLRKYGLRQRKAPSKWHAKPEFAGKAETGRALVQGGINKVIFIGSTSVGRAVMHDAAATLTPVTLELGGKDPLVVCGDSNLKSVMPVALRAAFQSCGQNCVAAERFIVHDDVYDDFVARAAAAANALRQGNPLSAQRLLRSPCCVGLEACVSMPHTSTACLQAHTCASMPHRPGHRHVTAQSYKS